jgi:hypothetical protein
MTLMDANNVAAAFGLDMSRYDPTINAEKFDKRAEFYLGGLPSTFQYQTASAGDWRIEPMKGRYIMAPGYFTGIMAVPPSYRLMRGEELWMSLAPMEIESQFPHFAAAAHHCGRDNGVLIMGLGLGYMVGQFIGMKQKGQFSGPITVIERDPKVVECFMRSLTFDNRNLLDECAVDILSGVDALTFKTSESYGLITADIWLTLNSEEARHQTRQMADNIPNHDAISWWGVELDYLGWMAGHYDEPGNEGRDTWDDYCADVGMNIYGSSPFLDTDEFYEDVLDAGRASLDMIPNGGLDLIRE